MSTTNNNQQVVATGAKNKMTLLREFFEKDLVKDQLTNALNDNKESFIASVIDLYSGDPYLQNCHPEQVAMTALKAAVLKLPVIKNLGFAYIVPYKSGDKFTPQLQIGYKGLIQLAIRTNQYRVIHADLVYEGEYKTCNKLTGEFDLTGERKNDNVVGYFAHFEMTNGFSKTLYMTRERVEAHAKKYSKSFSQASSPWKTEFDAMALKTVLRGLLSHWGYLSVEMQDAITEEDRDIADKTLTEIRVHANKKEAGFEGEEIIEPITEPSGPGY
jgi:recombination protein RecT